MKKIPTVFKKMFDGDRYLGVIDRFTNKECENAFLYGDATVKMDGAAVAVINGKLYMRYDAKLNKNGIPKTVPEGAIPCCDRDPITGHMPCWLITNKNNPNCKWHIAAYENYYKEQGAVSDGTYEAIGIHFQNNPYKLTTDTLYRHGSAVLENVPRTYAGIAQWLKEYYTEGIVFWYNNEPVCKIRRIDFRYSWNNGQDFNGLKQINY